MIMERISINPFLFLSAVSIVFLIFGHTVVQAETQPFDFTLFQEIRTEPGPFGLLVEDFNKDGASDLFVGHNGSPLSSILFGNGEGFFPTTNQTFYTMGGIDFSAGDFNEDGNIDVLSAGEYNRIMISFGGGSGTFVYSLPLIPPSPQTIVGVTNGDFNSDGHLDVVAVGISDRKVFIFFGDGNGNFSEPITLIAGLSTGDVYFGMSEVKTGDFNEDGNEDIVAFNLGEYSAFVFFGDGSGGFSQPVVFEGVVGGREIAIVDVNKDGHSDIISAGGVTGEIQTLLGDGSGNFSRVFSFVGGVRTKNLAIADFDGDGNFDIVATNQITGNIDIAKGDGSGSFTFVKSIFLGGTPRFAIAGDFNKDGFPDFAVSNPGQGFDKTYIFLNRKNQAPVFDPIGNKTVNEGETLTFALHAVDPDGDAVILSAVNLPAGATFDPESGVFLWIPNNTQSGIYTVRFIATDNGSPVQSTDLYVTIVVGDIPTPVEQADNLVESVINGNFPTNVENSYLANLRKVTIFIQDGKIVAAINQLNAFVNKVKTDMNFGVITQTEGDGLIVLAYELIDDLQ
ncbi:MAG: FG-GAP-like repeat-containing protein [Candidatus Paceibacterota bacterium]